ncbi:hypothetical protein NTH51_002262 [Vibrio fluvialis]|nr:hypothetical protein [Vibrio fluvialis]
MSELKPCPCARCGRQPEVRDKRIRFVVICECKEPFNYVIGNSVGFLDHIVDDYAAQIAFDAVNVKELRESAIEAWNIHQQLTTITKQRDELEEFVKSMASAEVKTVEVSGRYGGTDELTFICDSHRERAIELLSTIKEQKVSN